MNAINRREKKTKRDTLLSSDNELLKCGDPSLKRIISHVRVPEGFRTASEVESFEKTLIPVTTGCPLLDAAIGGGIKRRQITELYGESGCGKTQIALQVAASNRSRGVVYLSTEGAFPSRRLQQLVGGTDHLDKIFILQLREVEDLMKCIRVQLPTLLKSQSSISVVILDSIAAPFRGNYEKAGSNVTRAELLKEIGVKLLQYAKEHNLAVLCTNQVSANLSEDGPKITPCLGLAWSNVLTTRFCVSKVERAVKTGRASDESDIFTVRHFRVVTSPELPDSEVHYVITANGIVGLPPEI